MTEYSIKIIHLFPNLLNLYGDKGNIECMKKRLAWRGIDVEFAEHHDETPINFDGADVIFLGGGTERELKIVAKRLSLQKDDFVRFAENGGTIVGVCEGYELLGKSTCIGGELCEGLGVLDIYTELLPEDTRFTGDVIIQCDKNIDKVVGFENHFTKTNIGNHTPLGKVIKGMGNDGASGFEGIVYKNVYGTHLHGPLFPKNPKLCDRILFNALKTKYSDFDYLKPLDDTIEEMANNYMVNRG